ncbi:MAG TPA: type II toxin-antitoxin system RelE/ParE family toxin [Granulicella sp.]|nr:type II toxin-antitoxin system RelE/ParE family toxin [Granulicella sp.]
MAREVEFTDEFEAWWSNLTPDEQESVAFSVRLLEEQGIHLKRPHADTIHGSRFSNMRELRCQHQGRPYRILYAFDPRRTAMLLLGGDKTGNPNWYSEFVPKADKIYARHLEKIDRSQHP